MRIELERKIPVEHYAAFVEIAWLEPRPELALLCSAAEAADGTITPSLVQSVLPGTPERAAENIQRWCTHLGLCDRQGTLTAQGHEASETGLVPMPEQGVYELWVAKHPLLGKRVLHARRLISNREERFEEIASPTVIPEYGVTFQSIVDNKQNIVIRNFVSNHGETGCLPYSAPQHVSLHWDWNLDPDRTSNMWRLGGRLGGNEVQHNGETAKVDEWKLFSKLAGEIPNGRWDPADGRFAVPFKGLTADAVETCEMDPKIANVNIAGFGRSTAIRIKGLLLKPAAAKDAQAWALARLHRRLENGATYRSREDVRRLWTDLVEGTPLEPFAPELPSHANLLGTAKDPFSYWALAAPVDLSPMPVPEDTLGSMSLDKPTDASDTSVHGVRVPHRSTWSMQELVEQLVGASARRVVLCDRFVRGKKNLAMLAILVEAIQETASARVEVITDRTKDGENFPSILSAIGNEPKTYPSVFGSARRNYPHDRYLLVDGSAGAFAWQMSNSPLDARAEAEVEATRTTPLRWRDFSATRLTLEELPSDLAAVLGGSR